MSTTPAQQEQLRAMLATMLVTSPGDVTAETSLAALSTSLGSAKLRLGLKRLGLALPPSARPATYGGLLAALAGENEAAVPSRAVAIAAPAASSGALQVGVDVEEIHALPQAADYWEHEFYRGSFAPSEIAYAVLQPKPTVHFAGFWSAKEALRKCDPAFAGVDPASTAVAHDASGRPYLTVAADGGAERLPHAVSISHTTDVATAVVVTGSASPETIVEAVAPILATEIVPEKRKSRGLAKLFGI